MKLSNTLAALTAALTLTSAAPTPQDETIKNISFGHPFYITTSTSTLTDARVSANSAGFWIGKPTSSKCNPKTAEDYCPPGNETIFNPMQDGNLALASFGRFDKRGSEFVYIDGQRTYVAPSGKWGFVDRDNKGAPKGSVFDGWMFWFGALFHRDAAGNAGGLRPFACPVADGSAYRVFFAPGSDAPAADCETVTLHPVFLYGAGTYV